MTRPSFLSQLLAILRRFLSQIFKTGISTSSIFRQLSYLRSILFSKLSLRRKGPHTDKPPSSQRGQTAESKRRHQDEPEQVTRQEPQKGSTLYTIIRNGESISLEGIAASSLYPFSHGNIRNTSRASVRSSQNLSVNSRNASPSSRRPGSILSRRSAESSAIGIPLRSVTARHHHPAPRRQYSASAPHLQTDIDNPERNSTPDIQVTSPVNGSQTSLHIPSNPPLPQSYSQSQHSHHSIQENAGNSSAPYDHTFELPPSPSTSHGPTQSEDIGEHSSGSRIVGDIVAIPSRTSSSDSVRSSGAGRHVSAAFPSETQRYARRTRILKTKTTLTFEPMTFDYSKPAPPGGWILYAHPEGARYFYNREKRVYTDSEIYDPEILSYLEEDIADLQATGATFLRPFPESSEFVINAYRSSEGIKSEYYCVDHHTRLVFFLKEFHADWMDAWYEVPGVTSAAQLHIELQAQYWFFVQLFPSSIDLTKDMVCELRDIVLHLIGDSMTSPYSTACFTLDVLYKILTLTNELDKNIGPNRGSVCLLARKMYVFTHSRFLNFHGESSARIERDFSVYDDKTHNRRTLLIKTLSFVLFSAPDVHLTTLQKMWVDGMMHKSVWEESMKKMNDEWQEFIFFATVVLNSNVAFLAIQTVDVDDHPYRSPAQIASYLSVVANIASIILGLLLMRQNRTKNRETADDVQNFLEKRNHPRLGLESLAILYSLPYALLMWGMVAFLAAFAFNCFDDANSSTRSLVGSACFAMAILTLWCIYISWEEKKPQDNAERPLVYLDPDNENFHLYDEEMQKNETPTQDANAKPSALGRLRKFSARFKPDRTSYDSGKTAVAQSGDV